MKQQRITTGAQVSPLSLAPVWGSSFLCFALALREVPVFTAVANHVFRGAIVLYEALSPAAISGFFLIGLGMLVLDGRALSADLRHGNPQNN